MCTFLISYDLNRPDYNKDAITSAIMMLGQSWARPLDQTWYIKSDLESHDIEHLLHRLLDEEDALLVQCVEHAAMLSNTQLRWFKQRSQPLAGVAENVLAFSTPTEAQVLNTDFIAA